MARKKRADDESAAQRLIREDDVESAADFADPPLSARDTGLAAFGEAARRFKTFKPAREVLRRVRAVPTCFVQFDHGVRVGGYPIDRTGVIHGPSSHGKTIYSHGLGLSFLRRNHIYALIDAEMTTPITWLETLLGPYADSAGFIAARPKTYEAAVDDVRRVCSTVVDLRAKGKIAKDTSCLFIVDSIRKLVPEDIVDKIKKFGAESDKGSVDGFSGRAAQIKAALNAAWLDELVPLMHDAGCAIAFIAREEDQEPNVGPGQKPKLANEQRYKVGGGRALNFDSSMTVRVSRAGFIYMGGEDDKKMIGERHCVDIRKTKVAAKQDRTIRTYFHTSNGEFIPEGFDRARDVVEFAQRVGVVTKPNEKSAWLMWGRNRWNGVNSAVRKLTFDVELLDHLEQECRAQFDLATPLEVPGSENDS